MYMHTYLHIFRNIKIICGERRGDVMYGIECLYCDCGSAHVVRHNATFHEIHTNRRIMHCV